MTEIKTTKIDAPSIGSVELNYDSTGNRVRQIVQQPLISVEELSVILESTASFATIHHATRQSVRALVGKDLVDLLHALPENYQIEAQVPLSDTFAGLSLVYFGANGCERVSTAEVLAGEAEIIQRLHERQRKDPLDVIEKAHRAGFRLERLTAPITAEDMERLVTMYRQSFASYPFDIQAEIADMAQRETSCVYVARNIQDNMLYAVCATEEVAITQPDGKRFTMREMGDSARIQDPKAQGLNAPLKLMLLVEAFHDGTDLVFCESRAALGAVNANNYNIGMRHCGLLLKSTVISGPQDVQETSLDGEINGKYGNMNVWALNRNEITAIARQLSERR